jgi:hydroxymethylglutaryl-CoA lyase
MGDEKNAEIHSKQVRLVEVGPRDGLQNEAQAISTETKLMLIRRLVEAGLQNIEATAFVSPKWVPQMADQTQVMTALMSQPQPQEVAYSALTPNVQGFEAAVAAGAREVAIFAAASETFSQKNINCSIAESLTRFEPLMALAQAQGIRVRGYVSCVVGCPYEGPILPAQAAAVAQALHAMGCYEVSMGDTIGVGVPTTVLAMLEATARHVPVAQLAGHYHDTYGMAVANVCASYRFGVRTFDASVAGLGGCPYAKGASGNVATEDLVYLFDGSGISTNVDLNALVDVAQWISAQLGRALSSRAGQAWLAQKNRA